MATDVMFCDLREKFVEARRSMMLALAVCWCAGMSRDEVLYNADIVANAMRQIPDGIVPIPAVLPAGGL